MKGWVHSVESFGTVDGPGIRYVVFLQGCPMRCLYCHNPDTWHPKTGNQMSIDEIIAGYLKNKAFYEKGGLTVTGGEPLLQIDFVTELFKKAKENGIHTCLDTSGITFVMNNPKRREAFDRLTDYTDLVLLDIKHIDPDKHLALTGQPNTPVLEFAKYLEQRRIPVWIRHVIVPGHSDREEDLRSLGYHIGALSNLKALDVLPYHSMGVSKYEELGIEYPLQGLDDLPKEEAVKARKIILQGIRERRQLMV